MIVLLFLFGKKNLMCAVNFWY